MSPLPPCPYTVLGVSKDAQIPEIRTAYRKLVLKCHPDKVQDPKLKAEKQDEFQRVQQAYELLGNEDERAKYDDQVKLMELQKQRRAAAEANSSSPRTPTQHQHFNIRTAEPRPDSFKTKSSSRPSPHTGAKMYSPQPASSRSYEDDATRFFDEVRSARRQASYDDKPSRRDEERERERERSDRDRTRRKKEEAEEKERSLRAAAAAEKEARRNEKKRAEKAQEKERKREAEEKRRHKSPYVEPYDDDEYRISKSERKKSTSSTTKKHDDREKSERQQRIKEEVGERERDRDRERERERERERTVAQEEDEAPPLDKTTKDILNAVRYMTSARQKAHPTTLNRSQTYHEPSYNVRYAEPPAAVPTPPTAQNSPFAPPPISIEEDKPRRSSAKASARRSSDTPRARDKSSHKKSSSGPREQPVPTNPIVIDGASPRIAQQFAKAGTTPPAVPESPPRKTHLPRSHTEDFSRTPPQPPLSRSQTYHYSAEPEPRMADSRMDPRGRSRSRLQPQVVDEDSDDSERDWDHRRRRDRRHKTSSPQPIPADYPPPSSRTRYSVNNGRTVPMPSEQAYYREESSPPPRKSSKSGAYYTSHARPSLPPRDGTYNSSGGGAYYSSVKTGKVFSSEDVQYTNIPHSGYREENYTYT